MSSSEAEAARPASTIERQTAVAGLPPPPGPFAWSVAWGDLLFLSGLRGIDPATGQPAPTDRDRLRLIFRHLETALEASGSSLGRVLSTRVYVTDMGRHRPLVNEAFEAAFGPDLPTRTILEVSGLNQGDSIEVEVVAVRNERNS
jgi:2-iminobutanoate/2-iminopropanoate deaminase